MLRSIRESLLSQPLSGLVLAVIGAVATGMFGFRAGATGAMDAGFEWRSFGAGCLRVTYSFFAGILVYRLWSFWRPSINVPSLVVITGLSAILVSHPPERFEAAFDLVITIIAFPALIWLGANSVASSSMARVFTWLGTASYAVYILQVPVLTFVSRVLHRVSQGNVGDFDWPWGMAFVALIFGVAVIADRYFDCPVRGGLTTRLAAQRSATLRNNA
jgi:peptidoglycan/LPS O-acetylase OafA/YrhL